MEDKELEQVISEFVGAFEIVFRYDWDYSKAMMGDEEEGCNFIEPGLNDEIDNWGARGILLEKYRDLIAAMKERNMEPRFPVPFDRIDPKIKRVW